MGWNPFNAFRLAYDESMVMRNAEALVRLGLAGKGYRYVNIDGWWLNRNADGIAIRTNLFPSAALKDGKTSFRPFVDRLHAMGLKAGIYTDIGRNNCSQHWDKDSPNLPEGTVAQREVGTMDHNRADAQMYFADWGFDFIKVDACGVADYAPGTPDVQSRRYRAVPPMIVRDNAVLSSPEALEKLYADFAIATRDAAKSEPPVLAICAWGEADVNDWAGRHGQMWRTSGDIRPTWASMLRNFDSAAPRALFAAPGRWNDPDLLEIGNGDFDGDHLTEARAHMSLWAIIAAPLMLSYDLDKAPATIHEIAGNRAVIAINQDPAGNQGIILSSEGDREVIAKQLATRGAKALALINRGDATQRLSVDLTKLELVPAATRIVNVWTGQDVAPAGKMLVVTLAPRETLLLGLEGKPIDPLAIHPAEMPARISVAEHGFKPATRTVDKPWVPARVGFSPDGAPIMVDGKHDHRALGVAAGSKVHFALNGEFRTLNVSPMVEGALRADYRIYGDGRLLHRGPADGKPLVVSVADVRQLEFVAPHHTEAMQSFVWANVGLFR